MTEFCRFSLALDCHQKTRGLIMARRLFMKRLAWASEDWYGHWPRDSWLWEKLAAEIQKKGKI